MAYLTVAKCLINVESVEAPIVLAADVTISLTVEKLSTSVACVVDQGKIA